MKIRVELEGVIDAPDLTTAVFHLADYFARVRNVWAEDGDLDELNRAALHTTDWRLRIGPSETWGDEAGIIDNRGAAIERASFVRDLGL